MAYSTCVKCGSNRFEIRENTPAGSNYKLMFIQCSSCGGVVGVMDYYNIGAKIEELEKRIKNISTGDSAYLVNSNLDIVNQNVQKVIRLLEAKR